MIGVIASAIAARGQALIVLTGGGNGNRLMRFLATESRERIDWSKVHLFWGDDRYVTEDDDERNEKQAREALLDHIDIPARNVHAMPAADGEFGNDLAAAALAYEQLLAANAESGEPAPNFDVHLLGVGPRRPHQLVVPRHARGAREDPAWWSMWRIRRNRPATNHVDAARDSALP